MARIVGLVSSYREGSLAAGAVRSLLKACDRVLWLDGPSGAVPPEMYEAPETRFDEFSADDRVLATRSNWPSESAKRTEAVQRAKERMRADFVCIVDADEILIWGEYLRDYVNALDANEWLLPMLVIEPDGTVNKSSGRVFRPEAVSHYTVGSWQVELVNGITQAFSLTPADRVPIPGEPSILHRYHLRRGARGEIREHQREEKNWTDEHFAAHPLFRYE